MKPFLIDIAVAMVFFNRPDTFKQVFDAVAKARPSKIFLIQDGARANNLKDMEKINECRNIINIDWDCEIYEDFSEENLGCGKRMVTGITNAFKIVDRLVIIEDDIVIGEDMLPFCAEMLERYKSDERIGLISGMNHVGVYDRTDKSYFFSSRGGAIWGWATWKRVWNKIDWEIECVNDKYLMDTLAANTLPQIDGRSMVNRLKSKYKSMQKGEKQTSWTTQFIMTACILHHRLYLVPSKNLTSNIGLIGEHSNRSSLTMIPRGLRCIYFAPTYKLDRPLKHPDYVIDDVVYYSMQRKIMNGGFCGVFFRKIESFLYKYFPILGR